MVGPLGNKKTGWRQAGDSVTGGGGFASRLIPRGRRVEPTGRATRHVVANAESRWPGPGLSRPACARNTGRARCRVQARRRDAERIERQYHATLLKRARTLNRKARAKTEIGGRHGQAVQVFAALLGLERKTVFLARGIHSIALGTCPPKRHTPTCAASTGSTAGKQHDSRGDRLHDPHISCNTLSRKHFGRIIFPRTRVKSPPRTDHQPCRAQFSTARTRSNRTELDRPGVPTRQSACMKPLASHCGKTAHR